MANQFTKAEEEGREKPKGQNLFTQGKKHGLDAMEKAKIRAGIAADKLQRFMDGEIELSQAQVSAARALMDKGLPSLQAVEQKEVNDLDRMSQQEMDDMVRALITANPGLLQRLNLVSKPCAVATNAVQQGECALSEQPEAA